LWLQLGQGAEEFIIVGLIVNVVNIYIADDTFLVDDKDGAFAAAVLAQDAVRLSDLSVREKVAQEGIADTPQAICPRLETRDTVNADAQNLGVHPLELVEQRLVRRDLARSDRCPGQWEKGEYQVFLTQVIAQTNQPIVVAFQRKVWGWAAEFRPHG
jgi:hypothetical protein